MHQVNKSFIRVFLIFSLILMSQLYCDQSDVYKNALTDIISCVFGPTPGDSGNISTTDIGETSLTLNWTKATDNKTPQEELKYMVYSSDADNIDTVRNAEVNGIPVCDWTVDIDTITVTDLFENSVYYFNVIVIDDNEIKSAYTIAQFSTSINIGNIPRPGNDGIINIDDIQNDSISLSWIAALDNITSQENLEYRFFKSATDNIGTVDEIIVDGNGIEITSDWEIDISSIVAPGLEEVTAYYFNVIVRDEEYNMAVYNMQLATTLDNIPPDPGNSGALSAENHTINSLRLNWSPASDNATPQNGLEYRVYRSSTNNIGTIDNILTDGNGLQVTSDWTSNISTINVEGLEEATQYYFNILVRDVQNNTAAYNMMSTTTSDGPPVPGNSGVLSVSGIGETSLTLSWTEAYDNVTPEGNLQYRIYRATLNNIGSVADAEANGLLIDTLTDANSISVTGLSENYTYYFNVIALDAQTNSAAYNSIPASTLSVPPAPGGSGTITASSIGQNTLTLSWSDASDGGTSQSNLQYRVYKSITDQSASANNIASYAQAEANGEVISDWAYNVTLDVNSLLQNTHYFFNVFVRDEAGNIAAHNPVQPDTLAIAVYVSTLGSPGSAADGTSGDPYDTIGEAISVADASSLPGVYAATGTYSECVDLIDGISLYGGYNNSFTVRNPGLNITTISSNTQGCPTITVNDPNITNAIEVDGFTINGYNSGAANNYGIRISEGSPSIQKNTIDGGGGSGKTYGIYISGSSSSIIVNNVIHGGGGEYTHGIYSAGDSSSYPFISNNTINGGDGSTRADGIYCDQDANPAINNNIIYTTNSAQGYGIYEQTSNCDPVEVQNNNIFGCGSCLYFDDPSGFYVDIASVNTNVSEAVGNVSVDLISLGYFEDFASDNLHLVSSTPISVSIGGLNGNLQTPIWTFSTDKDGKERTTTGGWSIGAYEVND